MLIMNDVSVRYGGAEAVSGVSLRLEAGQWLMLCGLNGSGKTTLAEAAAGTVPYTGSILVEGQETRTLKPGQRAERLAVLSQLNPADHDFTVRQIAAMGRYARQRRFLSARNGDENVDGVLERVGLGGLADRRLNALSGGERQRVFLAQVFVQDAPILILDEPTHSLDMPCQKAIYDLVAEWLRQGRRAVLTVEHDLNLARRYGTHGALMRGGRLIASGAAGDVFRPGPLREAFGMDAGGWLRSLALPWTGDEWT